MTQEISKDAFWDIYEKLPEDLKDAIFSEQTTNDVTEVCTENGMNEELIGEVSKYTSQVLMGVLPPREFPITLELELDLKADQARNIASEIDRLVFSHLRISLNKLYTKEPIAEEHNISDNEKEITKEESPKKEIIKNDDDNYREPLI